MDCPGCASSCLRDFVFSCSPGGGTWLSLWKVDMAASSELSGKLLVGQSGGCTAVINSSLAGVVDEARTYPAITGVLGALHGVEGLLRGEVVDLGRESRETIARSASYPLRGPGVVPL